MAELALVDSNVIVYAFDRSDRRKHETARLLLGGCYKGLCSYAVSIQNLSEFYHIATKKVQTPLTHQQARRIVNSVAFFHGFVKISPNLSSVLFATRLSERFSADYWDCLLAATMLQNGISTIYTENTRDFAAIPGTTAINPFE